MRKYTLVLLPLFFLLLVVLAGCNKTTAPAVPQPTIAAISPLSGAAGTVVTITGANFDPGAANTVKFNGTAASITSANASQLVVTAPTGGSTGSVTVTTTGGTVKGPAFTYLVATPPPTITAITPASGSAGITVTITGTQFASTAANNTVKFGGVVATVQTATATMLTVQAPPAGTTGAVTVTNSGGTATGPVFTYLAAHDVYVLGSTAAGYCYWKNGVRTDMPADAQEANSVVTSICVSATGANVIVGGATGGPGVSIPTYWNNGASVYLPNNGNIGAVTSVAVSKYSICAAGYYYSPERTKYPQAWVGNTDYPLTPSRGLSAGHAGCVAVQNNDIYVSGEQNNGLDAGSTATFWGNGLPVTLGPGVITSIFFTGGPDSSIYLAGLSSGVPGYWKNGVNVPLTPVSTASLVSSGRILYVLGADIYVVGQGNGAAKYWKNAAMVGLTTQEHDGSIATCIHGAGNDVYIGGESDGVNHVWGYWEDGIFTAIPDCTNVYDIFVQ